MHIDTEIKRHAKRIKELVDAKKEGKKALYASIGFIFHFRCPRCSSFNTKRNGKTTQVSVKARHLCLNCNKFFVLTNQQIEKEIIESDSISNEEKKIFLDKYLL
jgi:transposase-like protein